jgi:hypothetical protein
MQDACMMFFILQPPLQELEEKGKKRKDYLFSQASSKIWQSSFSVKQGLCFLRGYCGEFCVLGYNAM